MAVSALYPQPPKPQQNSILSDPGSLLDLVSKSRDLKAKQAVGNAFQQSIGPDGSFDTNKAFTALKGSPDAAYAMPDAISSVLDARTKNIANATGQFNLTAGQNDLVLSRVGALAQNPNLTKDDVAGAFANLARAGVPPQMLQSTYAGLSSDPKTLRRQVANMNASAMGAAAAAGRVNAAPSATGAQQSTAAATPAYTSPTTPIGLAPGSETLLSGPAGEFVKDQSSSSQILANVRPLQQALPLIGNLSNANFGPGSPEFAKIKGALTTAGIINPNTSDLQVRQEANKYLLKYASGAIAAGRSDAALSAALGSNPNLDLTQPANMKLITNQIAMDRQDAAMTGAFRSENPDIDTNPDTAQKYLKYKSSYYPSTDIRAFKFDMMTPQERADLQKSLGPKTSDAYKKFVKSYNIAKAAGYLTPPESPDNGQQ